MTAAAPALRAVGGPDDAVAFACLACGHRHGVLDGAIVCGRCGGLLDVALDPARLPALPSTSAARGGTWAWRDWFAPAIADDEIV